MRDAWRRVYVRGGREGKGDVVERGLEWKGGDERGGGMGWMDGWEKDS